jgi:hypothetical protein
MKRRKDKMYTNGENIVSNNGSWKVKAILMSSGGSVLLTAEGRDEEVMRF